MSYYPPSGADPYGRPMPPQQPLSANDPYQQPGAPRPHWQHGGGYPGEPYPGMVDPYYPPNRAPDDADDELPRRFHRGWFVAIAIAVVALVLGVVVLQGSGTDSEEKPGTDERSGALTEQWRSGAPVSLWATVLVDQMLVGVECNQRAGPHADGADCLLRGRSLADGQQRWELTGQPFGRVLAVVGNVVVVSGDGVNGSLRENNAGTEQAHRRTLLVNAADGRIIATFENQIAWMHSQQTVVLRDLPAPGGRQTFTAVDVATGAERWKIDNSRPVEDGVNELASLLPSGVAPSSVLAGEFAVIDGVDATVVRELDTGKDLVNVQRGPGDATRYIAYLDDVLVRVVRGREVRVEGISSGNFDTPKWSTELGADAAPRQCSTMICVEGAQGSSTKLVNPDSGRIIATNDDGAMYVARSGDAVVVMRCVTQGSFVNPCPLDKARTQVLATRSGRQIWKGDAPVFALHDPSDPEGKLLVGTTKPGSDSTEVVAFSGESRPVELGSLERPGLVSAGDVQSEPVTDGYEPSFLPTRQCGMDAQRLVCGTRWQLNQVVSWRIVD